MKKYFKLAFLVFILVFMPIKSFATELDLLEMNVELTDTGEAIFTNKFVYDDDEGTEHYFVLDGLDDSKIRDFTVTRNGQKMEFKEDWDVDESFEEKAGKYGIVEKSDGYELCYGITEYGKNEFVVSYTLTNFVKQLEDTQMMYWEFISRNFSDEPKRARVVIGKEGYNFEVANAKIWAFGYKGNIVFEDGKIVASSNGTLNSGNKITVLTKFDEQIFSPTSVIDKDFMYYKEQAFEGSSYDINEEGNGSETTTVKTNYTIPIIIGSIVIAIIALATGLGLRAQAKRVKSPDYEGSKKDDINIKKKDYAGQYYREIPYDGPLSDIYLLNKRGLGQEFANYMTMYFLKWILEGRIQVIKEESGAIFKKEEISFKVLDLEYSTDDYLENQLYLYMKKAMRANFILESKDLNKWMEKNYSKIEKLTEKAKDLSREKLRNLGYLEEEVEINTFTKWRKTVLTSEGRELAGNLVKFENYLKEYSLLNEKDSYNVHIWDNLMLYAAIFGITEEVEKEFRNIYPEYFDNSVYDFYTIAYISQMSSRAYSSYTSASSGGGGSSSFGGGGGSFGGGGGGTR